jgi:hypothetical protein
MSQVEREKLREEIIRLRDEMLRAAEPILALKPGDFITPIICGRSVRTLYEVVKLLDLLVKYAVEESAHSLSLEGGGGG